MRLRAAAIALLVVAPASAVDGRVLDAKGRVIGDARVCVVSDGVETLCQEVDARGRFDLPDATTGSLRAVAPGYMPSTRAARGRALVVVLSPATALAARLFDASTGRPLDEGEVWVVYPSAKRKGPFPANRAGVRIDRVLDPGEARVVGRAAGFEEASATVTLVAGESVDVELQLQPAGAD